MMYNNPTRPPIAQENNLNSDLTHRTVVGNECCKRSIQCGNPATIRKKKKEEKTK